MDALTRLPTLEISYDRAVDVLYVMATAPTVIEAEDQPGGLELDFSAETGQPCGFTVIGFRRNGWNDRLDELGALTAHHLDMPAATVAEAVLARTLYR